MSFEVTVTGAALAEAAAWAAKLAPALTSQPILGGVLLVADTFQGGTLSFVARDNDTTGRIDLPDPHVVDGGRRLVSARLLADIARTVVKEPQVTLVDDADDRSLNVTVGYGAGWSLPLMPAEDYPQLPTPTTPIARVNAVAFARAVEQTSVALHEPELPPFHGGIVLDGDENRLTVVAGARYQLAMAELAWSPAQSAALTDDTGFAPVLVPGPVLSAALRAAGSVTDDDQVLLHSDGTAFAVSGPGFHVIGRVGAEIPPWHGGDMARPERLQHSFGHIDVAAPALRTALDRVAVTLKDAQEAVAVEITDDGEMSVSGISEKGSAAHPVEILDFAGRPCRYGLKLCYFRDMLTCLGADIVRLEFIGKPHSPMTLARPLGEDGEPENRVRTSVAPIRLPDTLKRAA
jgi:DNA polymerase III subunit beta